MTRTTAQVRCFDQRETSGAVDFDVALETLLDGTANAEALLCAAGLLIECDLPISATQAFALGGLTGYPYEIETYSDAAHAVRQWFAAMCEDETRH